jgi:hypothetical protein
VTMQPPALVTLGNIGEQMGGLKCEFFKYLHTTEGEALGYELIACNSMSRKLLYFDTHLNAPD